MYRALNEVGLYALSVIVAFFMIQHAVFFYGELDLARWIVLPLGWLFLVGGGVYALLRTFIGIAKGIMFGVNG